MLPQAEIIKLLLRKVLPWAFLIGQYLTTISTFIVLTVYEFKTRGDSKRHIIFPTVHTVVRLGIAGISSYLVVKFKASIPQKTPLTPLFGYVLMLGLVSFDPAAQKSIDEDAKKGFSEHTRRLFFASLILIASYLAGYSIAVLSTRKTRRNKYVEPV